MGLSAPVGAHLETSLSGPIAAHFEIPDEHLPVLSGMTAGSRPAQRGSERPSTVS